MATGDNKQPTQGGDMLSRCPDSHAEIAAKVGVDKSLVTRWRSGARKPTDAQQEKLEALYGIPRGAAWVESPTPRPKSADVPAPPPPSLPERQPPIVERDVKPPNLPRAEDDDENNNERLHRYIRDGMRELELDADLSGVKRAEALKKLVDAQVSLDRSTGENALTTSRIVAHPEFKRVTGLIVGVISVYPDAVAKVLEILRANQ